MTGSSGNYGDIPTPVGIDYKNMPGGIGNVIDSPYVPSAINSIGLNLDLGKPGFSGFNIGANQAQGMLSNIYDAGINGSIRNYDTAANRLRERIDSMSRGQQQGVIDQSLSRGRGAGTASLGKNLRAVGRDAMGQYAQGLSSLADSFESQRLQGLGQANQAAQSLQGWSQFANTLGQQDLSQLRGLNEQQYEFLTGKKLDQSQFGDTLRNQMNQYSASDKLARQLAAMSDSAQRDIARATGSAGGTGRIEQLLAQILDSFGSSGGA